MLSLLEFRRQFGQIRFAADSRDPKEQADRLNSLVPLFKTRKVRNEPSRHKFKLEIF
jgi:hypothetical protein